MIIGGTGGGACGICGQANPEHCQHSGEELAARVSQGKIVRNMEDPESRAYWEALERQVKEFEQWAPAWLLVDAGKSPEAVKEIEDCRRKERDRAATADAIVKALAERNYVRENDEGGAMVCRLCDAYAPIADVDPELSDVEWNERMTNEMERAHDAVTHAADCPWLRARQYAEGKR